jgi:hypothetical protein
MLTKPASTMLPPKNKYVQIQQPDYSKMIREPKATDFASINLEVNEYDKALDGKKSTMIWNGTPPLGRVYFHPTGETCRDKKTGKMVPQFTVVDAHRKGMKLMDLAERDFNNAAKLKIPTDKQIKADICVPVTIRAYEILSDPPVKQTRHVSEFDAENISPDIRESMTNERTPDEGTTDKDAALDKDMTLNMDAGQNLFIGSVAVLGLYLFFKVLYKRVR